MMTHLLRLQSFLALSCYLLSIYPRRTASAFLVLGRLITQPITSQHTEREQSDNFFCRPRRRRRFHLSSREAMPVVEVEQKFQLSQANGDVDLETKLKTLGFVSKETITFVDWYFDVDEIYLSINDYWLRYREKLPSKSGIWQIKIGRGHSCDAGATTVYEEIEGDEACAVAVSFLEKGGFQAAINDEHVILDTTYDDFIIPSLPDSISEAWSYGLRPFCRLETQRSSWRIDDVDNPYFGLSVDLDSTNTGHTVGEVESLCHHSEVEIAKARVHDLISTLCGSTQSDSDAPLGKLEHFLLSNRPWHYDLCVQSGVLQKIERTNS